MAGGWKPAAMLPLHQALKWADEHLEERKLQAHAQALQQWATLRTAFDIEPPRLED